MPRICLVEQRTEPRISNDIGFFIHVIECPEDADLVDVSVACTAVDVSTRGLQFKTEVLLPTNSLLDITIGIPDPFAMYLLRGEIRWSKEDDDEYFMGVLLQDSDENDYSKWGRDFDQRFAVNCKP